MFIENDKVPVTTWKFSSPSSTVWLLLTVEFLIAALLSGFLAILSLVKSLLPKPPRDLTGDVVLIAGVTTSLGESLAEEFANCGCSVICVGQDEEAIERIATGLKTRYPMVEDVKPRKDGSTGPRTEKIAYKCDLLNRDEILRTAQKVKDKVGRVDILVTCVCNMDEDIIDTVNKTLMSHFWTVSAFLPLVLYRDRGHIVGVTPVASSDNIGSRLTIPSLVEHLCHALSNRSSQLTFLGFSPIVRCRSQESVKKLAASIVQGVRTDRNTLDVDWTSRLLYRISCSAYLYIARFTEWVHSQESEPDYPA